MGPAAAFSLIGFLRALNEDQSWKLSSRGYVRDEHPIGLVRGYLVAYAVEFLVSSGRFTDTLGYVKGIMSEVEEDATGLSEVKWNTIVFGDINKLDELVRKFRDLRWTPNPPEGSIGFARRWIGNPNTREEFINFLISQNLPQTRKAAAKTEKLRTMEKSGVAASLDHFKLSARFFAQTVIKSKLQALGNRSFSDIRSWSNRDEEISQVFRFLLKINPDIDPVAVYKEGFLAAHVVSAAVMDSIMEQEGEDLTEAKLHRIFQRMTTILQEMNSTNSEWQLTEESSEKSDSLSAS